MVYYTTGPFDYPTASFRVNGQGGNYTEPCAYPNNESTLRSPSTANNLKGDRVRDTRSGMEKVGI